MFTGKEHGVQGTIWKTLWCLAVVLGVYGGFIGSLIVLGVCSDFWQSLVIFRVYGGIQDLWWF